MSGTPTVWLVRAGRGAEHVEQFVAGGFVSLGWARIAGLDDLGDVDEEALRALLRNAGRSQPAEDARELLSFRDAISVGDVIVTPDTPARDLLFGEVTGSYEFSASPVVGDHRHVRSVAWLGRWSRDLVDEALGHTTRHYQRTVLALPNQAGWLALAARVREGQGETADAPRRSRGAGQVRRNAPPGRSARVCPSCGITREASMFDTTSGVCSDCV